MSDITTNQRRARLITRHHLGRTAPDVRSAIQGVLAMHSSDPLTPYLGVWSRVPGFETEDLGVALHDERTLWRMHAMRRTLFVVDAEVAPMFDAGASQALVRNELRRVRKMLAGAIEDTDAWIEARGEEVVGLLSDGVERSTTALKEALPELGLQVSIGSGKWARLGAVGSPMLFLLAMQGRIMRTRTAGTWRASQYAWTTPEAWFGEAMAHGEQEEGRAALLRAYLERHGPATFVDLKWWTGWKVKEVRAALEAVGAEVVSLEDDGEGYVLPDDVGSPELDPVAIAMLPGLDPAPMSYKERGWFLGEHQARLFDRNGNIGPTLWLGGRIVGGWAQRGDGRVMWELLEDVGEEAGRAFGEEAARLEAWLEGVTVTPRFRVPLERELSA